MEVRRIVTGHNASGKSIFVADGPAPHAKKFVHVPGFETTFAWETLADAVVPQPQDHDPSIAAKSWIPVPGGTMLQIVTFAPDSVMASPDFDPAAAGNESMTNLPGLAERFEADSPGMHTTDSIDYGVLLDGEIHLELDDGEVKKLAPHDLVVQRGTRHAWRNRSDKPATMLFVLVGAVRVP